MPTLRSKAQFVSSQTLLSSGGLDVPRVSYWSQQHQVLQRCSAKSGDGGLPGRFWHVPYWPLPPLSACGLRCGRFGFGSNVGLHQGQLRWEWKVWGSCCRFIHHLACRKKSLVLTTRHKFCRRVVWDHGYWQHSQLLQTCSMRSWILTTFTTLADVLCEITGADNTP